MATAVSRDSFLNVSFRFQGFLVLFAVLDQLLVAHVIELLAELLAINNELAQLLPVNLGEPRVELAKNREKVFDKLVIVRQAVGCHELHDTGLRC